MRQQPQSFKYGKMHKKRFFNNNIEYRANKLKFGLKDFHIENQYDDYIFIIKDNMKQQFHLNDD